MTYFGPIKELLGIRDIKKYIGFIILKQLNMQKLSAKWVLKYLNVNQKQYQMDTSKLIFVFLAFSAV